MPRVLAALPASPVPESARVPPAARSPWGRPEQDPASKPGKPSGSHEQFLGDGGVPPKQVGPSGQEGQVTAVLPPRPGFLFYFKGVVYFVSFMFIKKLIV